MKKLLVVLAVLVLLPVSGASAATLTLGGNYDAIVIVGDGTVGGGSYDWAFLDGGALDWVFYLDVNQAINIPGVYDNPIVTDNGPVNGSLVTDAGQVASLVDRYGASRGMEGLLTDSVPEPSSLLLLGTGLIGLGMIVRRKARK